jgi:hypothetical protein
MLIYIGTANLYIKKTVWLVQIRMNFYHLHGNSECKLYCRRSFILPVLRIRIRMNPHQIERWDPDPHLSHKLDPDPDAHQSYKLGPDQDTQQLAD